MKQIAIYDAGIVYATVTNKGTIVNLRIIGGRVDIEPTVIRKTKRRRGSGQRRVAQ